MPSLTVCTPNLNHGALLPRAIEAIVSQSRPPDEYLLIDDGSTDDSLEIMHRYAAEHGFIRVIEDGTNRGVIARLCQGLAEAKGDYFYGAAADDRVLPGFFERALDLAARHPEAGILFGPMVMESADGEHLGTYGATSWCDSRFVTPDAFLVQYLDLEPPGQALGAATIYRADALRSIGAYREELRSFCDGFACRTLGARDGACYVAQPCVRVEVHSTGYSQVDQRSYESVREIVERAQALMRGEFRDVYPEEHVARWEARYRLLVLGDLERLRDLVVPRDLLSLRAAYLELAREGEGFDRWVARVHRAGAGLVRRLARRGEAPT